MKKIYLFTNIPSLYRKLLWKNLLANIHIDFHFFYGKNTCSGIQEIDFKTEEFAPFKGNLHFIKNIWIKSKVLIWQKGVIRQCVTDKADIVIFLGDMYCLSTWIAATICRLRKIEVVFWGHGIYGNEGKLKLIIRKAFYRLANKHLLYERRAKQLMINEGFKPDNLYVVFNSLDYDTQIKLRKQFHSLTKNMVFPFFANNSLPVLVFIGRLTVAKKLSLLIKAVNNINQNRTKVNLLFIGNGDESNNLENLGKKGITEKWLYFKGACYNEEEIGRYLYLSDLCVSPGNIGLTAIHSLSFGTPIATHNNSKNQGPESETIIDGYNGFYFKENDVKDLTTKIVNWISTTRDIETVRQHCYEIIDKYYNPNYQLSVFNRLIENIKPEL